VTAEIAETLGLDRPRGALVTNLEPNSPAESAGLKRGDLVLRVNGRRISNPAALEYRLAVLGVGKEARLVVLRRGQRFQMTVSLMKAPEAVRPDRSMIDGPSPLAGATVANLSPRLAQRLRLRRDNDGVVVVDVAPRSAAARLRVQPGDIILSVQGRNITSVDVLGEIVSKNRRVWRLTIDRKGRISNIIIGG
jgi:S1-C subfamily serine protease